MVFMNQPEGKKRTNIDWKMKMKMKMTRQLLLPWDFYLSCLHLGSGEKGGEAVKNRLENNAKQANNERSDWKNSIELEWVNESERMGEGGSERVNEWMKSE